MSDQPGRIMRMIYGVADEGAAREVTDWFARLLDITDWERVAPTGDSGATGALLSASAGIEYQFPAATTGFRALVFGVADLGETCARLAAGGRRSTKVEAATAGGVPLTLATLHEPVGGIHLYLGELPADDSVVGHEGRRNVGRIDHSVYLHEGIEEQERARDELRDVLGIEDWDDYGTLEKQGIRVLVSWGSRIELLAPSRPGTVFTEMIEERGMQLASMVVGVQSLDAAMARSAELGRPLTETTFDPAPPRGLVDRFEVGREVHIGPWAGEKVVLGEFKDRD